MAANRRGGRVDDRGAYEFFSSTEYLPAREDLELDDQGNRIYPGTNLLPWGQFNGYQLQAYAKRYAPQTIGHYRSRTMSILEPTDLSAHGYE